MIKDNGNIEEAVEYVVWILREDLDQFLTLVTTFTHWDETYVNRNSPSFIHYTMKLYESELLMLVLTIQAIDVYKPFVLHDK